MEPGSTLGLIGPNGGGKTTLVRLLLGLLEPTRGSIRVDGLPPAGAVRRGDVIGYLPQNPKPSDRFPLSVRQVVRLGLVGQGGPAPAAGGRDDLASPIRCSSASAIRELADEPVAALSGGQLQRATSRGRWRRGPKLLLLDEPTTGIDPGGQQRFIEFIQEMKGELGLTVIFVSHDLRAVSAISDRIACLNTTLHYHDVPGHLPPDLVYRMFACDLEAMGIKGGHRLHARACARHSRDRGPERQRRRRRIASDAAAALSADPHPEPTAAMPPTTTPTTMPVIPAAQGMIYAACLGVLLPAAGFFPGLLLRDRPPRRPAPAGARGRHRRARDHRRRGAVQARSQASS